MHVELGAAERRTLSGLIDKQAEWKPNLTVRLLTSPSALGVYSALPLDIRVFLAMPAKISGDKPFDRIVEASDVSAALRESEGEVNLDDIAPSESLGGSALVVMPPTEGWQIPMHAIASDLIPIVNEATAEFERRSKGLGDRGVKDLADEIWERPGWAGLPIRMLHAAARLQLLWNEPIKVTAATCGPWKRLSTPRGQVFAQATGKEARAGLRVVR